MKKILFLDDDPDILQVVGEVLSYEQYEFYGITTCEGFMANTEVYKPHLIILDYLLCDGNGGEICREIKAHPTLKLTPVIICSAFIQIGLDFKDFGCDAVINKPFDLQDLVGTVSDLLSKEIIK